MVCHNFFLSLSLSLSFWALLGGLTTIMLPAYSPVPRTYRGISIIRSKIKCKEAAEAAKPPPQHQPSLPPLPPHGNLRMKQKARTIAAAAARAAKDRQFKALQSQRDMGILLNKEEDDGEEAELAPSTPQKAATQLLVIKSPQQQEGGGTGEAARTDLDPSSLVQLPTLPPQLTPGRAHFCKINQDTWWMMDQQFAHPTHTSVGKDFMGSEDTLNMCLSN
jgi:hypothetical protein